MSTKMDFKKPYGEVYGGSGGHRYEQDGKCFDQDGHLIEEAKPAKTEAPAKAKAAEAKPAKTEAEAQVDAQLKG